MAQKRKPKNPNLGPLGVHFSVRHPESEERSTDEDVLQAETIGEIDADGHRIELTCFEFQGEAVLNLMVRHGVGAHAAAQLLRKLANHIDRIGESLLTMPYGTECSIAADGSLVKDPLALEYDENGQIIVPRLDEEGGEA